MVCGIVLWIWLILIFYNVSKNYELCNMLSHTHIRFPNTTPMLMSMALVFMCVCVDWFTRKTRTPTRPSRLKRTLHNVAQSQEHSPEHIDARMHLITCPLETFKTSRQRITRAFRLRRASRRLWARSSGRGRGVGCSTLCGCHRCRRHATFMAKIMLHYDRDYGCISCTVRGWCCARLHKAFVAGMETLSHAKNCHRDKCARTHIAQCDIAQNADA